MVGPVYNLDDFLNDAKNNPLNIKVEQQAEERAKELGFCSIAEIKNYLKELEKDNFSYVNTQPYRKHPANPKPFVDAYNIIDEFLHPYLAFFQSGKWWIKSIHSSDNNHDSPFAGLEKQLLEKRVKI